MNQVEIPLKITGIGAIKAELKELKGSIANATDPEEVIRLTQRAGELKDQLSDVNEQVNIFASGSKYKQVSNSFGEIGSALADLDFEKAQQRAEVFSKTLTNLNPADLAKGFKGFIGVIQTMGGAFIKLGMQILANPIFLLVAVITAIVVAIGVFLHKMGVLEDVLKLAFAPLLMVVEGFKMLAEWMGLTDEAAEAHAEAMKEASESNIKAIDAEMSARRGLYDVTKDLTNEEISKIEEQLGIEIDRYSTLEELEIEAEMRKKEQIQNEIAALDELRSMNEEQTKRYIELKDAEEKAMNRMNQLAIQHAKNRKKLAEDIDKQLAMLNAKQIKNEAERSKAILDIQEKEAIAKLQAQRREAARMDDAATMAKIDKLILLTKQDFERQRAEISNKGNAASIKAVKTTNTEIESAQSKHLKKMRQENETALQQAEADGKTEQELRDLRISQLEKEREYIVANKKKIYKLEVDQASAIAKVELDLKKARDKNFEAKEKAENAALIAKLTRAEVEAKTDMELFEAQKALIEATAKIKLNDLEVGSEERLLLEAETAKKLDEIEKQITTKKVEEQQKILAAAQLTAETELSQAQFRLERQALTAEQQISAADELYNKQLEVFNAQQVAELAAVDLTEEQKEAIRVKYDQARILAEEEKAKKINEIEAAQVAQQIEYATMGVQATQGLTELFFAFRKRKLKEGTKEAENAARQEFAISKAFNLGMAVIDGAKSITSILAQYPKFDGGFAMAAALTSAGIASAVNIGKIASAQFQGGGGAPTAPDIPTGGFEVPMATPNVSLFGSPNQFNNVGNPNQDDAGQTITVNAIVSETEVTNVQNKVNKIQQNAEL